MSAGIRELAVPEPVDQVKLPATVTATAHLAIASTITAVGSVALPPRSLAVQGTVEQPDLIERNIGRIFALVLVAILTSGLLGVQGPDRATVDHWATIIGVALTIAVLIWAGHK